jgi:O-antigen ligase
MELTFTQRLFYFFPVLFCFCLPFGSLFLSGMIVVWGFVSFFNIKPEELKAGFKNKNLWLLYIFFFITCLSAAFSDNKSEALFSIEIKLAFLFLPYYIYCFKWPVQVIKKCLMAFVSGSFFACMFLITRATMYASNGYPEYFFYTSFSFFIHASYFAMYLVMAIAIIFVHYPNWFKSQKKYTYVSLFFTSVFVVTIFLCSSKLGIISFFIIIPVLFLYKWKSFFNFKKTAILVVGIVVLMIFAVKLFPNSLDRLKSITDLSMDNIDKTSSESTTVRVLIWEQCIQLIKNNFLFGVTVGDANDALYKSYEANGLTGALSHKFNAHNQFFQTFIGLGLIGFLSLLSITFWQLIKAFMKKNILLLVFALLIVLNFMVESMLQTSAGTLFFVFFFCLFNHDKVPNEIRE